MTNAISSIQPIQPPDLAQTGASSSAAQPGPSFQAVLEQAIGRVEQARATAQQSSQNFLSGGNEELHSVVLAQQRASLAFDTFLQVRNKVLQAYQEVMRTQV